MSLLQFIQIDLNTLLRSNFGHFSICVWNSLSNLLFYPLERILGLKGCRIERICLGAKFWINFQDLFWFVEHIRRPSNSLRWLHNSLRRLFTASSPYFGSLVSSSHPLIISFSLKLRVTLVIQLLVWNLGHRKLGWFVRLTSFVCQRVIIGLLLFRRIKMAIFHRKRYLYVAIFNWLLPSVVWLLTALICLEQPLLFLAIWILFLNNKRSLDSFRI